MFLHEEITTGSYRFDDIQSKIFIVYVHPLHHFSDHFKYVIVYDQLGIAENQTRIQHAGTVDQVCARQGRTNAGQCLFMTRLCIGQFAVSLSTGGKTRQHVLLGQPGCAGIEQAALRRTHRRCGQFQVKTQRRTPV